MRLGHDLRRHHRSAACRARRVERCDASGAILGDAANDAVLGDTKGPHDVHLAAGTLADQLGGKHPKGAAVVLGVSKHRLNAAEVGPWPFSRTTLMTSWIGVAPSAISGNNTWGMVPSSW